LKRWVTGVKKFKNFKPRWIFIIYTNKSIYIYEKPLIYKL